MILLDSNHAEANVPLGTLAVRYKVEDDGMVSFSMLPAVRLEDQVVKRRILDASEVTCMPEVFLPMPASEPDSLVQLSVRGPGIDHSPPPRFANGLTLRGGESSASLKFDKQTLHRNGNGLEIVTLLRSAAGFSASHHLTWREGDGFVRVWTVFHNDGVQPLTLDMLASFSFSGITPFHPSDAPGRLWVHRIRSAWSAECRVDSRTIEDMHMERSWSGHGVRAERFGVLGSMPLRGYAPLIAVEDREAGVIWGAQLGIASSWQIEIYRSGDDLSISGGIADREFGHWWKTVPAGRSFATPEAILSVVSGDFQDVCQKLVSSQQDAAEAQADCEQELPAMFNEWCFSWGSPTHANVVEAAGLLRDTGLRYFVIDDGWAERVGRSYQQNGDWNLNRDAFPRGLKDVCDDLRAMGFIPGIWFEFEVCNPGSAAWNLDDHQLRRDGRVLRIGNRRFWDFRDPWTLSHLTEKVIKLLRDNGFGYLKVDYNETLGVGVDGSDGDGPGENLRQHIEGVLAFFREIRRQLPCLVIENCSSGGNRLVSPFLEICAMGQFSDAHETKDIPIIAAHLHHIALPRQLQVWAVLREEDDAARVNYSLAATLFGRVAISGDPSRWKDWQIERLKELLAFYRQAVPVIRNGTSRILETPTGSRAHPSGRQAFRRISADGTMALVIVHTFANPPANPLVMDLPAGEYRIIGHFGSSADRISITNRALSISPLPGFHAMALLIAR